MGIGDYVIYVNKDKYYLGLIIKESESAKNIFLVDLQGEFEWVEGKKLHLIENRKEYTILI